MNLFITAMECQSSLTIKLEGKTQGTIACVHLRFVISDSCWV